MMPGDKDIVVHDEERPLTPYELWISEGDYAVTLPERINRVVDEINERLADVLPEGMRFGWKASDEH